MVIASGSHPSAVAVAAAVRRDDATRRRRLFFQRRDEALPASRVIEKSVNENQGVAVGIAPFEVMELETAHLEDAIPRAVHLESLLSGISTKSLDVPSQANTAMRLTTRL